MTITFRHKNMATYFFQVSKSHLCKMQKTCYPLQIILENGHSFVYISSDLESLDIIWK